MLRILFFGFITIFLACTSPARYQSSTGTYPSSGEATRVRQELSAEAPQVPQENRKVIYDAYLTLVVLSPDSANAKLMQLAERYGGYVQQIGNQQSTIRVQSERLDAAITELSTFGKVQDKNITGQDVTEQYLDYQIRLENAQKARDRYLQLLQQATTVEEILPIEKELERLNGTIDQIQGYLNRLEHLVAYSTITIYWKEKTKPGLLGYVALGLYHSVKWLFVRN